MHEIHLVHDQQGDHRPLARFLEAEGFRVTAMTGGQRCLELIGDARPALVVMDVLIEGRNGFEVCRAIRQRFGPKELPVILCSQIYRSRLYREEAQEAGAQRYVLKPAMPGDLLREIHEVLWS